MLTFISGWRSPDRDNALIKQRDPQRPAVFFIDDSSSLPMLFPDAPIIDVWRTGRIDFHLHDTQTTPTQIVRINYDTDNSLIALVISRVLMQGTEAQLIILFDAVDPLYRLYQPLRASGALLAADSRLDAAEGDHVIFTRGGSFVWTDHLLESQTATLVGDETLDMGIVSDEDAPLNMPAPDHRW
jgi:hypothetical protein